MDESEESQPTFNADIETEVKELMGLFDLPAFARRGYDLEITVRRLHGRCASTRVQLLDMVQLRLKQWSWAGSGPGELQDVFLSSIEELWPLAAAGPPAWAKFDAPIRRRQTIASDLIAAVLRFNRRWTQYIERLNLEPTNFTIDQYNRYYVLEKECVIGSARLAARHFQPMPLLTAAILLEDHPMLPIPELVQSSRSNDPRRQSPATNPGTNAKA